jgi:hypothetical protein
MADIVLNGDTSGAITVSAPAVAGTNTLTLPASTGTVITTGDSATVTQGMIGSGVAGTGPAFSAYASSSGTITSDVWTKVPINTEGFDTNSNFDTGTYRFTPTVAGYYSFTGSVFTQGSTSVTRLLLGIYKNGVEAQGGIIGDLRGGTVTNSGVNGSVLLNMNGTTDYAEFYLYESGTVCAYLGGSPYTYFQGHLVRSA